MWTAALAGALAGGLMALLWELVVGRLGLVRARAALRRLEEATAHLLSAVTAATGEIRGHGQRLESLIAAADRRIARLAAPGAEDLPAAPAPGASGCPPPGDVIPDSPARHAGICRLADSGLSAFAIARQLNLPRGEVELILGLRKLKYYPAEGGP